MSLWRVTMLGFGVLGPLGFAAIGFYGARITPGYDQVRDAVSALSQRGAANAVVINRLFLLVALLQVGFGAAVAAQYAGHDRRLYWAGLMIMLYAALGAAIAAFFPMDPIGAEVTVPGVLHLVFVAVSALALIAAMLLGPHVPGAGWFAGFSYLCLLGMFAGGGLSAAAGIAGWPVLGLAERLTQYSYLLWLMVLAAICLGSEIRSAEN